jgi:hypothetical protein
MSGNLSEIRLFLVELRKEIGDDIEISVRCSGPSKYALRGKEWIVSRNWPGPTRSSSKLDAVWFFRGKSTVIVPPANARHYLRFIANCVVLDCAALLQRVRATRRRSDLTVPARLRSADSMPLPAHQPCRISCQVELLVFHNPL